MRAASDAHSYQKIPPNLPLLKGGLLLFDKEGRGEIFLSNVPNDPRFGMSQPNFIKAVKLANPATYYKEVVVPADINLTF